MSREARTVPELGITPIGPYAWVVELGQPDRTESGLYVPDNDETHWQYRNSEWRFGKVVAVGPDRTEGKKRRSAPDVELGDYVLFSRRHGTRLEVQFEGQWLRILDVNQIVGVVEDWVPWWNPAECQKRPSGTMTG